MTQPPDQTPDQPTGLPPEQEAVRRLLADARHDAPTPDAVVARLEATLASLSAERTPATDTPSPSSTPSSTRAPSTTAPVVDLAARRRRRAGVGLLAAAAVVVAGVALGQGLPSTGGGDAGSAGSASDADMSTSQRGPGDGSDGGGSAGSEEAAPESTLKSSAPSPFAAYPTLSTDDTDLDDQLIDLRSSDGYSGADSSARTRLDGCDLRGTGPGRRVVAQVDGMVGAVVFRRADGATQRVDLYTCGDPTAVRSLVLPAP